MTSRHTRSNAQGPLQKLTNEELARLERQNRQKPGPTDTNMGDHDNQDDLTAAMALMQQQMQHTIQAQQAAAAQAAENAEEAVLIGQRNFLRNMPATRSAINPPPCTRQDFEIKKEEVIHDGSECHWWF
ncbi:hypothetical protein F2Q69_00058874 [Brassica cretica]|uniref:Uncharacterized protein n=1 Tax=Brassica cretica TaxID=69181 RepID=A0A8S9RGM4_BRACR|nr:hypothetical protein F2Q69_00058874 [Brassica cretica]